MDNSYIWDRKSFVVYGLQRTGNYGTFVCGFGLLVLGLEPGAGRQSVDWRGGDHIRNRGADGPGAGCIHHVRNWACRVYVAEADCQP